MKDTRRLILAACLAAACAIPAHAALTWNNAGPTNNWSTAAGNGNWTPGNVVWTNGEDAIFGSPAEAGVSVTTANTVDDITFNASWTIGNGAGSLTLADANSDITVDPTFTATIQETIAGGGFGITKLGTGTLVFTNNTTYTGATNISAGMLQLNSAITTVGTSYSVGANATLRYNSSVNWVASGNAITLNGGTLSYVGSDLNGRYVSGVGPVAVNSASAITVSTGAGAGVGTNVSMLFLDGALTGSAALSITSSTNGRGVSLRSASSTYSGTITVNGNANAAAGVGSGLTIHVNSNSNLANADIIVNGMFDLGNAGSHMTWGNGAVSGTTFLMDALGGNGVVTANMATAASTRTLSVGNNNGGADFSGAISNGANNTFSLVKNGLGTQVFSGTNTYTGTTAVNNGTLLVNGSHTGAGGGYTVANGATLGGTGSIARTVAVNFGGTLAPGASTESLAIGSLTMAAGSNLGVEIGGVTAGALVNGYDQLIVTGSVNITDAILNLSLVGGFNPGYLDTFFIVTNDSGDAVVGTFAGLADNTEFTAGGGSWIIRYNVDAGSQNFARFSGNDIAIQSIPAPAALPAALTLMFAIAASRRRQSN